MKQIMFSRMFPAYHPRKGEKTNFVNKIWKGFFLMGCNGELMYEWGLIPENVNPLCPKYHTIRAGHRFEAGEYFAPKVWTGLPYKSKPYQFAPPVKIEKVWNFTIINRLGFIGDQKRRLINSAEDIAQNDGLSLEDWLAWFKFPDDFQGQIICWNPDIEY